MAVSIKVEPISRDIQLMMDEMLSPEARSQALASYAREQFAGAQAANRAALGREPDHDVYVDGARGVPPERVKPDGTIVYEFELLPALFGWIDLNLIMHSPVKSGRYRKSHVFLADGQVVDPNAPLPDETEFVYINTQPYARKIERGQSKQSPAGVYQAVATLAAKRFGNVASIKFTYRVPLFGEIDAWANKTSMTRIRRRSPAASGKRRRPRPVRPMEAAKRAEWLRRQPAIVVRLR